MPTPPIVISLPIADRPTSFAFYRDGLGFESIGEPAGDGLPEPLQFQLDARVSLMLVPTDGFGWVVGDRRIADGTTSECVLGTTVGTDAEVDALVERAVAAGATLVTGPTAQPWGYAATFTDPDGHLWMVASAATS